MSRFLDFTALAIVLVLLSCGKVSSNKITQKGDVKNISWEEVFKKRYNITPQLPDDEQPISVVRDIEYCDGRLYLMDGENKRILSYSDKSNVRVVGSPGTGPSEFEYITNIESDKSCDIYAYDPSDLSIKKLNKSSNSYSVDTTYRLNSQAIDIEYTDMGLAVYSLNSNKNLFLHSSNKGTSLVEKNLSPFYKFSLRFSTGGISYSGSTLKYVPPKNYTIFSFRSPSTKVTYRFDNLSDYIYNAPSLPTSLSPYKFTKSHANWWSTFPHISDIYTVNDTLSIVSVYYSEGQGVESKYLNIHSGRDIIAEGIEIPNGEHLLKITNNNLYTTVDPKTQRDGSISPTKVYRYYINKRALY